MDKGHEQTFLQDDKQIANQLGWLLSTKTEITSVVEEVKKLEVSALLVRT